MLDSISLLMGVWVFHRFFFCKVLQWGALCMFCIFATLFLDSWKWHCWVNKWFMCTRARFCNLDLQQAWILSPQLCPQSMLWKFRIFCQTTRWTFLFQIVLICISLKSVIEKSFFLISFLSYLIFSEFQHTILYFIYQQLSPTKYCTSRAQNYTRRVCCYFPRILKSAQLRSQ